MNNPPVDAPNGGPTASAAVCVCGGGAVVFPSREHRGTKLEEPGTIGNGSKRKVTHRTDTTADS